MSEAERIAELRDMYGEGKNRHAAIELLLSRLDAAEQVIKAARFLLELAPTASLTLSVALAAYDAEETS